MKKVQLATILLDLLADGATLQTIIDRSAEILEAPLVIADTRFRILYMSSSVDPDIAEWKSAKESRYISDKTLANMEESGIARQLSEEAVPLQAALPNQYHAVRCPLRYRNRYRGFLGMYDYLHVFSDADIEALEIVSKAVTSLLPTDTDLINVDENAYESLLYQLLRCETDDQAALVCKKQPAVVFSQQKQLILIMPNAHASASRLKDIFRSEIYRHISVVLDNQLVLLFELDKMSTPAYEKAMDGIRGLAERYQLLAAASFPFTSTAFVPYAYRQAELCLRLEPRSRSSPLVRFEDCMMDSAIAACLSKYPADFYIHPIIQKLKAHDRDYNLNYLETLRIYILCNGNLKATAAALDIHYNTIKYRMAVIENIAGQEITGAGELLPTLYFSMLVEKIGRDNIIMS